MSPRPEEYVPPRIEVRTTPADVARAAADRLVEAITVVLERRETARIGLAGGSTPKAMYELLGSDAYRTAVEWRRVEIYFGDEREVPPDHADSNYAMAKAALLDRVGIPGDNINRMKAELGAEEAAMQYEAVLREAFGGPASDDGLDVLLLGMGDDAHTLSLFPKTPALFAENRLCVANRVEKLAANRVTLTADFANRSGMVLTLVTGKGKAQALTDVLEGPEDPTNKPLQLIRPTHGLHVLLADVAATGMDEADD